MNESPYIDRQYNRLAAELSGETDSVGISGSTLVVVGRAIQKFRRPAGDGTQDTLVLIGLAGLPILVTIGADQHQVGQGDYVAVPLNDSEYFTAQTPGGGVAVLVVAVGKLDPQPTQDEAARVFMAENPGA